MRGRDTGKIRFSDFDVWDRSENVTRAIPVVGANAAIDFVKLPHVNIPTEVFAHRAYVTVVLIGRDLIAAIGAFANIANKGMGIDAAPSSNVMTDEQLGFGVDC